MIIENFNLLSQEELETFATDFVKKINEANILSGDIEFKIDSVESNEITGDLYIAVSNTDDYLLPVVRSATWTCGDEDELHDRPEDPDYAESIYQDARASFKETPAELDGYLISIDIDDVDTEEYEESAIEDWSNEDAGIGSYEYWGHVGYDSRPYLEVEGTITWNCSVNATIIVSPKIQD